MYIFQERYTGQKIKDELISLVSLSSCLALFLTIQIYTFFLFAHIELSEVIQIDHIFFFLQLFNVLLPRHMSFPTSFINLTSNSSLNFSYVLFPSLVLSIFQVPT